MMGSKNNPSAGIFGGSFDPIHVGHLILARDVLEQTELDEILFIPASQAPLRQHAPLASGSDRLDLVRAAITGESAFHVSDVELEAGGDSYTVDTINSLRTERPDECFSLIIGADQFEQLSCWHRVEELIELTEFICLERPDTVLKAPAELENLRWRSIKARPLGVSSTEIRDRLRNGLSVQHFLPESALEIIRERGLYAPDAKIE